MEMTAESESIDSFSDEKDSNGTTASCRLGGESGGVEEGVTAAGSSRYHRNPILAGLFANNTQYASYLK